MASSRKSVCMSTRKQVFKTCVVLKLVHRVLNVYTAVHFGHFRPFRPTTQKSLQKALFLAIKDFLVIVMVYNAMSDCDKASEWFLKGAFVK